MTVHPLSATTAAATVASVRVRRQRVTVVIEVRFFSGECGRASNRSSVVNTWYVLLVRVGELWVGAQDRENLVVKDAVGGKRVAVPRTRLARNGRELPTGFEHDRN